MGLRVEQFTSDMAALAKELAKLDPSVPVPIVALCVRTGLSEPELREEISRLARLSWRVTPEGLLELNAETVQ